MSKLQVILLGYWLASAGWLAGALIIRGNAALRLCTVICASLLMGWLIALRSVLAFFVGGIARLFWRWFCKR